LANVAAAFGVKESIAPLQLSAPKRTLGNAQMPAGSRFYGVFMRRRPVPSRIHTRLRADSVPQRATIISTSIGQEATMAKRELCYAFDMPAVRIKRLYNVARG
jgi:hypothetical protein